MNWEAISGLADLFAAVAVLVTLIYVAVQIKQAREEINLAGQRHRADAAREVLSSISDSPLLAGIFAKLGEWSWPDFGLTEEETIRWACWCHSWMRTEEMSFRMASPVQRETQEQLLKVWLSTTWGARFWVDNQAIYDADFATKMNELLEQIKSSSLSAEELLARR